MLTARRLLRDPAFAKIADSRTAQLRSLRPPRRIETLNYLLELAPWATGVKTGHTFDAGYVLHIDAAVEDMRDSPSDVVVPLTSAGAGMPNPGRRYVANLSYGL